MKVGIKMTELAKQIYEAESQIYQNYQKVHELRAEVIPNEVTDYEFVTSEGEIIYLKEMFADQKLLVVVHNMGSDCEGCSMWAEGMSQAYNELIKMPATFYISSPETSQQLTTTMKDRNWKTPMVSVSESTFAKDMGFQNEAGNYIPGVSVFRIEEDSKIVRIQKASLYGSMHYYGILSYFYDLLNVNNKTESINSICRRR